MEIKDGSNYSYNKRKHVENLYSWGWVGSTVLTKGWTDKVVKNRVIDKLKVLKGTDFYMGHHACEMCQEVHGPGWSGLKHFGGSVYIRHNGKIYCSPMGVEHYIEEHDYKPPQEVIDAVLNGDTSENLNKQSLSTTECIQIDPPIESLRAKKVSRVVAKEMPEGTFFQRIKKHIQGEK